jgi:hypothetical protein
MGAKRKRNERKEILTAMGARRKRNERKEIKLIKKDNSRLLNQ